MFAQANGRPIDASADRRAWKRLLEAAQIRPARLHDARHTTATLLLLHKVDARIVQQVLGHSQISLTQNTYQHVTEVMAAEAAEAMGRALWT